LRGDTTSPFIISDAISSVWMCAFLVVVHAISFFIGRSCINRQNRMCVYIYVFLAILKKHVIIGEIYPVNPNMRHFHVNPSLFLYREETEFH
jgi:hypothetical protein